MQKVSRPLALVTGASSGIGAAFARELAARGADVALVARRLDRLETLAASLKRDFPVDAFAIQTDLSHVDSHIPVMQALAARGRAIDTLVNNAGFSLPKTFAATAWSEQRDFVMTLVMAVCGLTHAALPGMLARGRGAIINVGSMAGLSPGGAGHTLYPAAKSFVMKFTLSLDAEVRARGVRATCILPGVTESEFSAANGTSEKMASAPRAFVMTAAQVAQAALAGNDRGHTIVIPGFHNKIAAALMKYLPDGLVAPIVRAGAEKYRVAD